MIGKKLGKKWRDTNIFASHVIESVNRPPTFRDKIVPMVLFHIEEQPKRKRKVNM